MFYLIKHTKKPQNFSYREFRNNWNAPKYIKVKSSKPTAKKSNVEASSKGETNISNTELFPIVCIGASAGGLEAIEQFLSNVPTGCGMCFVVIQHLDPTQKGMLPELLQRKTKMEVLEAKDHMPVEIDTVYVIPPNTSMSLLNGNLYLAAPKETRGMRLPIDFFLKSLADDRKELGVGIILSGMGSDGSSGIRHLKEVNGRVLVQSPETAKFDSMPRSAIEAISVDIIAPASELPAKLIELLKHKASKKSELTELEDKNSLEKIIILLRSYTGNDFSQYKKNTLYRRIERRMAVHKIDKINSYVHFLKENPNEGDILFKEVMIGVTNFFRDINVWEHLKNFIIPSIIRNLKSENSIRAWVPGCSTGEEAYSLAIIIREVQKKMNRPDISIQIFATDLDNDAIEKARKGLFFSTSLSGVSPDRLQHFFVKTGDYYQVTAEIREMVVFAQHNLTMHPPFTKIDFLSCRNLLIYMDSDLQKKVIGLFYYSMNPEGFLLLGSSESLGSQSFLFSTIENKLKFYQKTTNSQLLESFEFPTSFSKSNHVTNEEKSSVMVMPNIQVLADQLLLKYFSPVGVLVNEEGDIIYTSGRTGKYLEPSVGKANLNIFAMLREGLKQKFPTAFRKVVKNKETIVLQNIKAGTKSDSQIYDISIQSIDFPVQLKGNVMIIFKEVPRVYETSTESKSTNRNKRQIELEEELLQLNSEMQNTVEEMQTSQEELKSTNEELQSTNEELQSTNEELTSSKEEMQSLNEELQTVNAELLTKVEDYSRVNNDMKNLLNSTDIATLFLDKELNIRRFTNQATKIFKLIKSDIGRPFTDQVTDLIYPDLENDALEVLKTLVFIEKQIPAKDGRWFSIRIMPYRTHDDRIDGLVITFINISDLKHLELDLEENVQIHRMCLDSSSDIFIILSDTGIIKEFNPKAELFFGFKRNEVLGKRYVDLFVSKSEMTKIDKEITKLSKQGKSGKFKMTALISTGKEVLMNCNLHFLMGKLNTPKLILMMITKE
ncbi:PAS domain-containing protein [Algoriphagus lutimaris]|uniref:chemotaxis protein CheB n=1 Tax=Algoriphagus lutimaris TaxID=613197 RepID=UPI00196A9ECB|nr:chemotaxis protein CheB [Algoriphagus lutimaris]MBN3519329.1 PAS domain-containing protein [Algoriphagus lutimaris]